MTADEARRKFPGRLRQAMALRNSNRTRLARALGVDRKTVSLWSNGSSMPIADQLAAISEELDVTADWLLGQSDNPYAD